MSKFSQIYKISGKKEKYSYYKMELEDPYKIKKQNESTFKLNHYCEYCGEKLRKEMIFCPRCNNYIKDFV
ncbi:MAG: hypothetical protein KGD63_10855 [Candidatus Lokiarchaeota archaeon]|nr:hypothetical protein [Candidatus Lokiarchaeota archaeon]